LRVQLHQFESAFKFAHLLNNSKAKNIGNYLDY
jgi:hypothetical protein